MLLILLAAFLADLHWGKIPNQLLGMALILGTFYQIIHYGIGSLCLSSLRAVAVVAVFFLLFHIRVLGAGDIKLLSVICFFFRWKVYLYFLAVTFVAGAVLSLTKMLKQKTLIGRLWIFIDYVEMCVENRAILPYPREHECKDIHGSQELIHFSSAILIGYLVSCFWE